MIQEFLIHVFGIAAVGLFCWVALTEILVDMRKDRP